MTPLSNLCVAIVDSEHKTAPKSGDGTGYPLIRTTDIERGRLDLAGVHRIDAVAYEEWTRRAIPQPGDLILAREAPVGNVALVTPGLEPVLGQRTVLIRPDQEKVDARFLTYRLLAHDVQHWMRGVANGATVPHLNMEDIRALPLPDLPSLRVQRDIGATLSAFDDLLENNGRRIEVLEETVRLLYREWFVHFRFPGHETANLINSSLGPIPEGWTICSFADIAEFVNGFAFNSDHWGDDGLPIVKIRELKKGVTADTPRYHGADIDAKYKIDNGSVLFSWSADLEAYIWGYGPALLNQHLFDVRPQQVSRLFVFHALRESMNEFRSRAQGTTMKHIKRAALAEVQLALPHVEYRNGFENMARPLLDLQLNLARQNQTLRAARDLLFPRLVSGGLDVSVLGRELEAAGV